MLLQENRKQVAEPGADAQLVVVIGQDVANRAGSGPCGVDLYKPTHLESSLSLEQAQIWQPRYICIFASPKTPLSGMSPLGCPECERDACFCIAKCTPTEDFAF